MLVRSILLISTLVLVNGRYLNTESTKDYLPVADHDSSDFILNNSKDASHEHNNHEYKSSHSNHGSGEDSHGSGYRNNARCVR